MAKFNLNNAFRLIPVGPEDWNLLGICWKKQYYIDTCLPFGLCSASFLFSQHSMTIHWTRQHRHHVCYLLLYLDNFFTAGSPDTNECYNNLMTMLALCKHINAPVKPSKIVGSSTCLLFLGIIIDTTNMQASISEDHKPDLLSLLLSLKSHHKRTKQQLLSLIGKLSFGCKVITTAGRTSLRRLIDTSCKAASSNQQAHLDIGWWLTFISSRNDTCYILETEWSTSTSMSLY